MHKTVFVVIPSYNEETRIVKVINDVLSYADKIIVVDDGSSDATYQKVKVCQSTNKIILLRHKINLGQGAALETGFEYCRLNKADIVVTYDADGQFVASEIEKIIRPIQNEKAEVVLGSRFLGKTQNMPPLRKLFLKVAIVFTNIFSGIKVNDTHNGFRAFSKCAINLIKIRQPRMAHASEIIDLIAKNKLKYVEVPVTVIYDEYTKKKGQSLWNSFNIIVDILLQRFE